MARKIDWEAIERDYIGSSRTYRELAKRHSVGLSSIELRASKCGWKAKRDAYRSSTETITPEILKETNFQALDRPIDLKQIISFAISRYYEKLPELEPRSLERATDSLCRLIELQLKINPPTPAQWAEVAIAEFGLDPVELWAEVKSQWQKEL